MHTQSLERELSQSFSDFDCNTIAPPVLWREFKSEDGNSQIR